METGDLVFFKSRTLIGKSVSLVTSSEFSHVALALDENTIIEANAFIRTRITDLRGKTNVHVYRKKGGLTEDQKSDIVAYARDLLGRPYDYTGNIIWLLRILLKCDIPNLFNDLNRLWCSELVDYLYTTIDVDLLPEMEDGDVTPANLLSSPEIELVEVYEKGGFPCLS